MKLQTLTVMLIVFLNGCAFDSGPKDNQEFYQISEPSELHGVYENKGDPSGYLSNIIWGNFTLTAHPEISDEDIEFIEVSSSNDSLIVKAIRGGCSIYKRSYVPERDFKVRGGKIIIYRDLSLLTRGPGDVLVGPSYEQIVLGLDTGKHGKYRHSTHGAGLAFLILPLAFSGTDDTRFERVNYKAQGFSACSEH